MSIVDLALPTDLDGLTDLVATGDQKAFDALYDSLGPQVYGVILRVLRDPAQSEEVAQEVLVEVWRSASRFDRTRGSARGWVLTIAHRRAVDRVRSEHASRQRERTSLGHVVRPFDEVLDVVERRWEAQAVRASLAALTSLQREAIVLAYFGGHTYREVAERLEAPLDTIKSRMRDGLIRLRAEMAGDVERS